MQIHVNIDDDELNEVISKGLKNLSEETITDLAKQAVCEFLSKKECIESLLFETRQVYGYSSLMVDYENPRRWFIDLIKNSFDESELKEYRDVLYKHILNDGENIVIRTMANVFAGMLFNDEYKRNFSMALVQLERLRSDK